ncbi:MAG: 3'-5' exonuclease [Candidatus Symbiothrix sp.]|jgi:DNA polymerase III epsilon subunit-like protein|nr:3'-5' exonuclease [Candidatus Symbiothrix sp.]
MILFFDTETTGLPKNYKAPVSDIDNWPRLVQLAYMVYDFDGHQVKEVNHIVKPLGFTIPTESTKLHRITTEKAIRDGKDLKSVLVEFQSWVEKAEYIVAHNIAFDEKIIGAELYRIKIPNFLSSKTKICTMQVSTDFCALPGSYGYKYPSLSELYDKLFNTSVSEAHDALVDIKATVKCFWELEKKGIIKIPKTQVKQAPIAHISPTLISGSIAFSPAQKELELFALNNQKLFINIISKYYPFTEALLLQYKNVLNFSCVVTNIIRDLYKRCEYRKAEELINNYQDNLNWALLSRNISAYLIDKYIDKWSWENLSQNAGLPWDDIKFIEKYENKWDIDGLLKNKSLYKFKKLYSEARLTLTYPIQEKDNDCDFSKIVTIEQFKAMTNTDSINVVINPNTKEMFGVDAVGNTLCTVARTFNEALGNICVGLTIPNEEYPDAVWIVHNKGVSRITPPSNRKILEMNGYKLDLKTCVLISQRLFSDEKKYCGKSWSIISKEQFIENHSNEFFAFSPSGNAHFHDMVSKQRYEALGYEIIKIPNITWNYDTIHQYYKEIDWDALSENIYLPWTVDLIEKYLYKWNWENLSKNQSLPWSVELLEKYIDKWDWNNLSLNEGLPWQTKLLNDYLERWNWKNLSSNIGLPWCIVLIDNFIDKWNWDRLSENEALPWSEDFIDRYVDNWNWNSPSNYYAIMGFNGGLSKNKSLPWSLKFIDKYNSNWDWDALSSNTALPWSIDLIEKYKDKWLWYNDWYNDNCGLSMNEALPWSLELIQKFRDKWVSLESNEVLYHKVIKPHLTEDFVNSVLQKLRK